MDSPEKCLLKKTFRFDFTFASVTLSHLYLFLLIAINIVVKLRIIDSIQFDLMRFVTISESYSSTIFNGGRKKNKQTKGIGRIANSFHYK